MAVPKCPSCESTRFEMQEMSGIMNSRFKYLSISCISCGSIVGVVDHTHNGTENEQIKKMIKEEVEKLRYNLSDISYKLQQINNQIR